MKNDIKPNFTPYFFMKSSPNACTSHMFILFLLRWLLACPLPGRWSIEHSYSAILSAFGLLFASILKAVPSFISSPMLMRQQALAFFLVRVVEEELAFSLLPSSRVLDFSARPFVQFSGIIVGWERRCLQVWGHQHQHQRKVYQHQGYLLH